MHTTAKLTQKIAAPFLCVLSICLLSSCQSTTDGPVALGTLALAKDVGGMEIPKDFRLMPGDEIEVKFYYVPDLNDAMRIRPDGKINLSLIPTVMAAGKTPEELEAEISELYAEKVDNSQLSVVVRSLDSRTVYIDGEVVKPQALSMGYHALNVANALAEAGGTRRSAKLDSVILMRQSEGKVEATIYDLSGEKRYAAAMIRLMPGDIIFVPKSSISEAGDFVDLYINGLMPDFIRFNAAYSLGSLNDTSRNVVISDSD